MSAYMDFYFKTNTGEFIPLGTYSRCSDVFQAFRDEAQYEQVIAITSDVLECVKGNIKQTIYGYKNMITYLHDMIDAVTKCNDSLDEKMERIWGYRNDIDEYNRSIEEQQKVLEFISHLRFLMDAAIESDWYGTDHNYDKDDCIYLGYEAAYPWHKEQESN